MRGHLYYRDENGNYHFDHVYDEKGHISSDRMKNFQMLGYVIWINWDVSHVDEAWYRYEPKGGAGAKLTDDEIPKELKALRVLYTDQE